MLESDNTNKKSFKRFPVIPTHDGMTLDEYIKLLVFNVRGMSELVLSIESTNIRYVAHGRSREWFRSPFIEFGLLDTPFDMEAFWKNMTPQSALLLSATYIFMSGAESIDYGRLTFLINKHFNVSYSLRGVSVTTRDVLYDAPVAPATPIKITVTPINQEPDNIIVNSDEVAKILHKNIDKLLLLPDASLRASFDGRDEDTDGMGTPFFGDSLLKFLTPEHLVFTYIFLVNYASDRGAAYTLVKRLLNDYHGIKLDGINTTVTNHHKNKRLFQFAGELDDKSLYELLKTDLILCASERIINIEYTSCIDGIVTFSLDVTSVFNYGEYDRENDIDTLVAAYIAKMWYSGYVTEPRVDAFDLRPLEKALGSKIRLIKFVEPTQKRTEPPRLTSDSNVRLLRDKKILEYQKIADAVLDELDNVLLGSKVPEQQPEPPKPNHLTGYTDDLKHLVFKNYRGAPTLPDPTIVSNIQKVMHALHNKMVLYSRAEDIEKSLQALCMLQNHMNDLVHAFGLGEHFDDMMSDYNKSLSTWLCDTDQDVSDTFAEYDDFLTCYVTTLPNGKHVLRTLGDDLIVPAAKRDKMDFAPYINLFLDPSDGK